MSSWGTIYNSTVSSLRTHMQMMERLQEQVASGKRVIRTSDDPSSAHRILQLRSQSRSTETYIANLDNVVLSLEQISSTLQSTSGALIRVRELATQATTGTLNQDQRNAISGEIDGLLEQVVSETNQQSLGRYIFSGHSVGVEPYAIERSNGKITSVKYQGATSNLPVSVAPGVKYSGLMVGDEVFRSHARTVPQFLGSTGATIGTGTASVTGDVYLTLQHHQTTYNMPAHGLATSNDTNSDDTIIGNHTITINADQTIQLDGGTLVSFTLGATKVKVTNDAGESVYVDVSSWDGSAADVTVVGELALSIDDGATSTIVSDFSSDAAVTDGDGHVLYVNPAGITSTGLEPVRVAGTYDLFGALINMRDLMANERNFSDDDQVSLMLKAVEAIEEVTAGIQHHMTASGARLQAMDSLRTSLDNIKFTTDTEADSIEEADIVELATELAQTQTLYQMTMSAASKLLSMSLLDYI